MTYKPNNKAGFTFLEMALVLLIISMLVGAVMVGASLIRASNINSVLADAARYSRAITEFRDKYDALPGDMPNAESFWGTPAGGCPNGTGTLEGEVCNGNGDGVIYNSTSTANIAELRSEWIELANAGLIQASYQYSPASGGTWEVGANLPITNIGNGSFLFYFGAGPMGDGLYTDATPYNIHWMSFGNIDAADGIFLPIFSGEESYGVDKKIDDGKPGTGILRASRNGTAGGNTPNCHTTTSSVTAEYDQTRDELPTCFLMFALPQ